MKHKARTDGYCSEVDSNKDPEEYFVFFEDEKNRLDESLRLRYDDRGNLVFWRNVIQSSMELRGILKPQLVLQLDKKRIVYGSLGELLQQKATTKELLTWVNNFPTGFNINNFPADYPDASSLAELALILAQLDSKTSTLFKSGQNIGNTGFNASNLLNPHPVSLASIPNPSNLDVALSTRAVESGGNLAAIAGKDFATQTTLAALNTKVTACNTGAIAGSLTQSTKHDSKTYLTKVGRINATGLFSIAVANKLIKVHSYSVQSESDSQTAYFYEETSGTQLSQKWVLNSREGAVKPFVYAPAQLFKTATTGKDLGLNLAAATYVDYEIQYSIDDAT
jgi:hypothetical protein